MMRAIDVLRPDAKGRITLGGLAKGISSFHVTINKDNSILLEPYAEIPLREQWLFKNKNAMDQVSRGIKESAEGKIISRGKFFNEF